MSVIPIHSWTVFLDLVEHFPRRNQLSQEERLMSRRNGTRSRYDLNRKKRMHQREQIREISKGLKPQDADTAKTESTKK